VQNPVALLPVDNNGVLLNLPLPPVSGAATLAGTLIFGINTETNNQIPGTFKVFTADPTTLTFTTTFHNTPIGFSFIDSGSNGFFYDNPIWGSVLARHGTVRRRLPPSTRRPPAPTASIRPWSISTSRTGSIFS
jgi:hypothetical protein